MCAVAMLNSCSGKSNNGCLTNCGGGNANLTISFQDTPPTGTNVLSFTLPIAGISLTPSTGSPAPVAVAISSVEVTRLQSDSIVIVDQASVPAAGYTAIAVTIGPTTSSTHNVFINTSGSTITSSAGSCLNGTVCDLPLGAIATITIPLSLNLSANQNQWIGLDFNLNKAITSTGNNISVDFTQAGVMTATTSTRTGIPSGSVDTLEDFVGVVSTVSGTSITVQSGTSGASLTAAINSGTEIDIAPVNYSQCSGSAAACLKPGSTVSIDALVSSSGTFTATEIDVLDAVAVDEVEGIIYPTKTAGVFGMILADKSAVTSSALSASAVTYGSGILLTLGNGNYSVDTKTLSSQLAAPTGFSGSGDLLAGQVVRAQVTGISTDISGNVTAIANDILLRYSRLSGKVNSISGNTFTFTAGSLPSYVPASTGTPQTLTYPTLTAFDGITGLSDPAFQGASASIRALYLNNSQTPFQAAKVRVP